MDRLRIVTRRSPLALAQTQWVASRLTEAHPGLEVELVPIVTTGDRNTGPLVEIGGKGLFTIELEEALRAGEVDLAVHSAKDLPTPLAEDLPIIVTPVRADARDALVSQDGSDLASLPTGARVGTSSLRRQAQLLRWRKDITTVPIRGNVGTRLKRALTEEAPLDAVVLAMAGLERSGLVGAHQENIVPLAADCMIPASGQGVLAIQGRRDDEATGALAGAIHHEASFHALTAERMVVAAMAADCRSALAAYVWPEGEDRWAGAAMAARPDGTGLVTISGQGLGAAAAAADLIEQLNHHDAKRLLTMS